MSPKPRTLQRLLASLVLHSQQRRDAHFCRVRLCTHHGAVATGVSCVACLKHRPVLLTFCGFEKARSFRAKHYAAKLLPESQFGTLGEIRTLSNGSQISLFDVQLNFLETKIAAVTSPQMCHLKPGATQAEIPN